MKTREAVLRSAQIGHCLRSREGVRLAFKTLLDHYYDVDVSNFELLSAVYAEAHHTKVPYWDVRAAVRAAAHVIRPQTYLEVGARIGWSLAQVFAECPDVRAYVVDQWIPDYGGYQGTPAFLREKMKAIVGPGHAVNLEFLSGNSHDILPEYLPTPFLPNEFDLITVDGDHTRLGAWWDLTDLFPRVAVGGAIVFDDLECVAERDMPQARNAPERPPMPDHFDTLLDIWDYMRDMYPSFAFHTCTNLKYRAGVAVRLF